MLEKRGEWCGLIEVEECGAVELGAMVRSYGEEMKGRVDNLLLYPWCGEVERRWRGGEEHACDMETATYLNLDWTRHWLKAEVSV